MALSLLDWSAVKKLTVPLMLLMLTASVGQACGGSDAGVSSSSGGGVEAGPDGPGPEDATVTADAGSDGEAITDGGSNIDPDSGEDAGACAAGLALVNDAPARQSDCVSILPLLGGGAIVPGKYHLTEVHALASKAFCDTQFVTVGFRETTLVTAADAAGSFAVETVLQLADGAPRRSTALLTPGPGNTSPMQAQSTCPDKPPGAVRFASFFRPAAQRQRLVMLLPYGQGLALYVLDSVP